MPELKWADIFAMVSSVDASNELMERFADATRANDTEAISILPAWGQLRNTRLVRRTLRVVS